MDSELLELLRVDEEEPTDVVSQHAIMAYGKHSIYSHGGKLRDVRDILLDHYEGRHTPHSLIERGRYPVYLDEIEGIWPW